MKQEPTQRKKLVLIDGHAIIHRAYHALPPLTVDGVMVNAVFGFTSMLIKILHDIRPDYLALSFDVAGKTFRDDLYEEYKATREKADDALYAQIPLVVDVVKAFDIPIYEQEGYEADDLIGTVAHTIVRDHGDVDVIIVTGDKDMLQLVEDKRVEVYLLGKGMSDFTLYDDNTVKEKFGFAPEFIPDFKGLMGDPSDNIPGVQGIGKKTATDLLTKVGSIETIYKHIEQGNSTGISPSVLKKLQDGKASAELSKTLATIVRDVPNVSFVLEDTQMHSFDYEKVKTVLAKFEFFSLIKRLGGSGDSSAVTTPKKGKHLPYTVITEKNSDTFFEAMHKEKEIVCKEILSGKNAVSDPLQALLFVTKKAAFSVDTVSLSDKNRQRVFALFTQKNKLFIGHDIKQLAKVLLRFGVEMDAGIFDVMIASYIVNSSTRAHELRSVILRECGVDIGETMQASLFADDGKELVKSYEQLFLVYELQRKKLKELAQEELFFSMEMNVLRVLARMELAGITVDSKALAALSQTVGGELSVLTKRIYEAAGQEFNINSSAQLREVLFDVLDLPTEGLRKGKTGFSTAASELEKLHDAHEIIPLIEQQRELTKLQNTYIDVLPSLINHKTGRIHTTFNQAVAATGRLSSSDPNLQNIPVRTEYGKKIREAFVADDGFVLVSADYSQIELRIVASLADDKKLIEIFEKGEDVHKATAAAIHGVALEDVTPEMRRSAKEVNFGVLYGMGAFGLAERTGISQYEARAFIKKYFDTFSGVKTYIDTLLKKAKELGYVETIYGRRRYIQDLSSSNFQLRSAAERMAVNMPIQGTQADIVKFAMIAVDELLDQKGYYANNTVRMLLQVHDELVFEIQEGKEETIAKEIQHEMESVITLAVPIIADVHVGKRWGSLK